MTRKIRYGFETRLSGSTFGDAVPAVVEALKAEGFGVLAEIDIRGALREKIGAEGPPHVILAACNPGLAKQALDVEPDIGLLLPCNVVVRENDEGEVLVSAIDPSAIFEVVGRAEIAAVALEVEARLRRALDALPQ